MKKTLLLMSLVSASLFAAEKIERSDELPQASEVTRDKYVRVNVNGSISEDGAFFITKSGKKHWISDGFRDAVADFKGKEVNLRGRAKLSPQGKVFLSVVGQCKELSANF